MAKIDDLYTFARNNGFSHDEAVENICEAIANLYIWLRDYNDLYRDRSHAKIMEIINEEFFQD